MAKYNTKNELEHFDFTDSYLSDIQSGINVALVIDQVKILPENSCNRDIRVMRCNQLEVRFEDGKLLEVIEEGNKVYDANGNLMRVEESRRVGREEYKEIFELLYGREVFEIRKDKDSYQVEIGGDDHLYTLVFEASGDTEHWERFLNLGEAL